MNWIVAVKRSKIRDTLLLTCLQVFTAEAERSLGISFDSVIVSSDILYCDVIINMSSTYSTQLNNSIPGNLLPPDIPRHFFFFSSYNHDHLCFLLCCDLVERNVWIQCAEGNKYVENGFLFPRNAHMGLSIRGAGWGMSSISTAMLAAVIVLTYQWLEINWVAVLKFRSTAQWSHNNLRKQISEKRGRSRAYKQDRSFSIRAQSFDSSRCECAQSGYYIGPISLCLVWTTQVSAIRKGLWSCRSVSDLFHPPQSDLWSLWESCRSGCGEW